MKAIILAAGKGSRISDKIGNIPKSTLKLEDETPLIRREVINMLERGISPVVCVGYMKEHIYKALNGLDVKYYDNPFYSITNNIVSLWFAREEFDKEDILLTSADLYYPGEFLDMCITSNDSLMMTVDSSRIETGDFYFNVKDDYIQEYGPQVPLDRRTYEYMGLTKISGEILMRVRNKVEDYVSKELFNAYFEDMIISMNMEERVPIGFIDVKGKFWREIDFYIDYEAIIDHERAKSDS